LKDQIHNEKPNLEMSVGSLGAIISIDLEEAKNSVCEHCKGI